MISGPAFCKHGRLADGCEDCAMVAALERGYVHPHPDQAPPVPAPERAEQDLYCDHGDGRMVFVAAGDPIPTALVQLPRIPRSPAEDKPTGKRGRGG